MKRADQGAGKALKYCLCVLEGVISVRGRCDTLAADSTPKKVHNLYEEAHDMRFMGFAISGWSLVRELSYIIP